MKTLMKDNGLTVTELDNGQYLARIEHNGASIEQTFSDYEAMQRWVDEELIAMMQFEVLDAKEDGFTLFEVVFLTSVFSIAFLVGLTVFHFIAKFW